MASTWSSLGIRLMTTGENDNTWVIRLMTI